MSARSILVYDEVDVETRNMSLVSTVTCSKCETTVALSDASILAKFEDHLERECASFFCLNCKTRQTAYVRIIDNIGGK